MGETPISTTKFAGKEGLHWFYGIVEDRNDPEMMGRVRCRAYNWNTQDKILLPTDQLIWAYPIMPYDSASVYPLVAQQQAIQAGFPAAAPVLTNGGVGWSATGILVGSTVFGFFLDGLEAQRPIILGTLPSLTPLNPTANGIIDQITITEGNTSIQQLLFRDIPSFAMGQDTFLIHYFWDEPTTEFQGRYPFVKAYNSEQGHHLIIDDTPQHQLLRLAHQPSGSYVEINPDRRVDKTVGDQWNIVTNSAYRRVSEIEHVRIGLDRLEEIGLGNETLVGGAYTVSAGLGMQLTAGLIMLLQAIGCIDLQSVGPTGCINLQSVGPITLNSDTAIILNAPIISENGGIANPLSIIPPDYEVINGGDF